jgi:CIC family chloride channel protein
MLVGMGVAAAIAAVLHTPITAVLISRELVLRRFRLSALGPIVLASVTSWLLASTHFESRPVLAIPASAAIAPQLHLAAFAAVPIIAIFAWGAVILWARLPGIIAAGAGGIGLPLWLLPALGGPLLGVLAMAFPQALGIGYEPLTAGLGGNYSALLMPVLALAKIAAAAITLSFRWGGGSIAPSLYIGAMLGSSLGVVAGLALGDASSAQVYFGVVGMAVALAVLLNTPFAAAMLALELSGSPQIGAACLAFAYLASMGVRRLSPPAGEETEQTLRWR